MQTAPSAVAPRQAGMADAGLAQLIRHNLPTLKKTATYYVLHVTVAALVAYAVTGNFLLALTPCWSRRCRRWPFSSMKSLAALGPPGASEG